MHTITYTPYHGITLAELATESFIKRNPLRLKGPTGQEFILLINQLSHAIDETHCSINLVGTIEQTTTLRQEVSGSFNEHTLKFHLTKKSVS